jgi:hypothetical protein
MRDPRCLRLAAGLGNRICRASYCSTAAPAPPLPRRPSSRTPSCQLLTERGLEASYPVPVVGEDYGHL